MKHIFVVNPSAGSKDQSTYITEQLKDIPIDAEVYITRATRDATRFVAERCRQSEGEALRFYACGGDGTLNEVVSGVMESGAQEVAVGCLPYGSGNDYIKNWPSVDFTNIKALVEAPSVKVDVIRLGDRYCVNVLNYGFEAEVCRTMSRVRRWPLLGGRMAYVTGIVHCLLHARHNPCRILVDGELWQEGDMLLGSAACGRYVGGGYMCAPRAVLDDGLLEALCINSVSIPRFAKLIGFYQRGEHLDCPEMADIVHYRRGHRVCFEADREFSIVVDGELIAGNRFEAECLPKALNFIIPA